MKYIYNELDKSLFEGIIKLFESLNKKYCLNINAKNFMVWKKAGRLYEKFGFEFDLKKLLPIEYCLQGELKNEEVFESIRESLHDFLDDENVYKVAKLMGLSFDSQSMEKQIIFEYLKMLVSRKTNQSHEIDIFHARKKT